VAYALSGKKSFKMTLTFSAECGMGWKVSDASYSHELGNWSVRLVSIPVGASIHRIFSSVVIPG